MLMGVNLHLECTILFSLLFFVILTSFLNSKFIKPGVWPKAAHAWFLEIVLICASVCVGVCCVLAPQGH